jgi:hypothetical protein
LRDLRKEIASTREWFIKTLQVEPSIFDDVRVIVRDEQVDDVYQWTIEEIRGSRLGATIVIGAENLLGGTDPNDAALKHEFVHALQLTACSRRGFSFRSEPGWLLEGIATYASGRTANDLANISMAHLSEVLALKDCRWDLDDNSSGAVSCLEGILFVDSMDSAFGRPIMENVLRRTVHGQSTCAVLEEECAVPFGEIVRRCRPVAKARLAKDMEGGKEFYEACHAMDGQDWERASALLGGFLSKYPKSPIRPMARMCAATVAIQADRNEAALAILEEADREDPYPPRAAFREVLRVQVFADSGQWKEVIARGEALLSRWKSRTALAKGLAEPLAKARAAIKDSKFR